jgi:hypothetical protein
VTTASDMARAAGGEAIRLERHAARYRARLADGAGVVRLQHPRGDVPTVELLAWCEAEAGKYRAAEAAWLRKVGLATTSKMV